MNYKEFSKAIKGLKDFFKEQDKLDSALHVISPSSTGVCEFGNKFIDDYINVLEIALGDDNNWVSWFVFENNFGEYKLDIKLDNKTYIIKDEEIFYNVLFNS